VARYQVTLRDAAPFMKRRAARSVGNAVALIVVAMCLAVVSGGDAGLTTLGIGLGLGIGLICGMYLEYRRAKSLYGPEAESIELTVTPEIIVFTTEVRHTSCISLDRRRGQPDYGHNDLDRLRRWWQLLCPSTSSFMVSQTSTPSFTSYAQRLQCARQDRGVGVR
jgi:hypothetical protein